MDITVAIPNYNGRRGLERLLPSLDRIEFKNVFLLDDCSSDDSVEFVKQHYPDVFIVKGSTNVGAGPNRNRILHEKNLGDVIWFIDADMELITRHPAAIVASKFAQYASSGKKVSLIGWRTLDGAGEFMPFNYGYLMSNDFRQRAEALIHGIGTRLRRFPFALRLLNLGARRYTYCLDIMLKVDEDCLVDWVAEGNFCVITDDFRALGGFDENMRYHEGQDFGKRLRDAGKGVLFCPRIRARHLEIDVRGKARVAEQDESKEYLLEKHRKR